MKLKLAHLYYDLMNLYGENGNLRAIMKRLNDQKIKYELHFLTIDDEINFNDYDFFYIGMGCEENQKLVLKDLLKYKSSIQEAIHNNKFFLITGNAIELFGKHLIAIDNKKIKTLGIFEYYATTTDFRIIGEQLFSTKFLKNLIIGFQNRCGGIKDSPDHLFSVIKGTGYEPKSEFEGIKFNNFYATYLLGPLLIRNPHFTDYLLKALLKDKGINYKKNTKTIDYIAYKEYKKNFVD